MTAYDRLDLLFQQNNGIVKTAQVLEIGIAKSTFYAYARHNNITNSMTVASALISGVTPVFNFV